jgi:hypothetical protein
MAATPSIARPGSPDPLLAELVEAARALAAVTEDLIGEIAQRQGYLQELKVPLETWVPLRSDEYDWETGEEDRNGNPITEARSEELEFGWTRDGKEWVLAVRTRVMKETESRWKDVSVGDPTRLLEAPREQQLLALEHFGDLVRALTARAKQAVANIRTAKA